MKIKKSFFLLSLCYNCGLGDLSKNFMNGSIQGMSKLIPLVCLTANIDLQTMDFNRKFYWEKSPQRNEAVLYQPCLKIWSKASKFTIPQNGLVQV